MPPVISLHQVTKRFNAFTAVDKLSFTVERGDIYGFLGPNGSGKSTTLRMIMSLIRPDEGDIRLFGDSLSLHRAAIMKRIGCIIEKPDFYTYLSARENLALFARVHGLNYSKKQYGELFEMVGLSGREGDKVKAYSHGMKQRLGLALALLHDPDLIILDEPNTGLDPQGIIDLRQLIVRLNREKGKTILFSSHILSEVQQICTQLVVISKGKAVVQGSVAGLLSTEHLSVQVETLDRDVCQRAITNSRWSGLLQSNDENGFNFHMSRSDIPELIHYLDDAGVPVVRVDYRNQLEEYFLKITQS